MNKNIGPVDRVIRAILGIVMIPSALFFVSVLWLKIVLIVVGVILIFTAITGFCGLYTLFGINTCRVDLKK
ncbi:MAG: DUF2892 domain-containing protein [bacterium]|nr:DUF2892 domain-containing protein [bacterium]